MKAHKYPVIHIVTQIHKWRGTMNDVNQAIELIKNDEPVPLDLFAKLMQQGIDLSELERKYNGK